MNSLPGESNGSLSKEAPARPTHQSLPYASESQQGKRLLCNQDPWNCSTVKSPASSPQLQNIKDDWPPRSKPSTFSLLEADFSDMRGHSCTLTPIPNPPRSWQKVQASWKPSHGIACSSQQLCVTSTDLLDLSKSGYTSAPTWGGYFLILLRSLEQESRKMKQLWDSLQFWKLCYMLELWKCKHKPHYLFSGNFAFPKEYLPLAPLTAANIRILWVLTEQISFWKSL